ncbi:hypothetical protein ACJMK2_036142 [Sinanodonta woodiana]|uniref:Serine aminopeptidase S33 domain-containing protein n=1 Tax=Sinanodonta woodiana TaxID=1069815 RepID=A0ABD3WGA4_SINWO
MKQRSGADKKQSEPVKQEENATKYANDSVKDKYSSKRYCNICTCVAKIVGLFLFTLYVFIPVLIKTNPWIFVKIVFLNHVTWPPFVNYSQPNHFGLNATRNFYLHPDEDSKLGIWHVLPTTLSVSPPLIESHYEDLLSKNKAIIIYFHGNSGSRAGRHRVHLYKVLANLEFHVLAVDYRGYGDSSSLGYPTEDGVVSDARYVYNWVRERSGNSPVFIWGHSLGTGITTRVAKELCTEGDPPAGVILESPFNNIREAALGHWMAWPFKHYPWLEWALIDSISANNIHFASDQSIRYVTVPLLIMHAEDDWVVPIELGTKLYEAALSSRTEKTGPVKFVTFNITRGYGHKHIHMAPELPDILREFVQHSLQRTSKE